MKVSFKYLWEDRDRHGNIRRYVKVPGRRKVRLRAEPGTAEFQAAYDDAIEGAANPAASEDAGTGKRAAPGSLLWLFQRYFRESVEYKRLEDSTRRVRRTILTGIALERFEDEPPHGDKPFAKMEAKHVRRIRDVKADLPEAANARVKALRQVFKWATDPTVEIAAANPARDVGYFAGNGEGWHTWTVQEVAAFARRHPLGTKAYLAMTLLLFTGVRRSDAVRLGPQMVTNGWLEFTETKGRSRKVKDRALPVLPQLQAAIDACSSGHLTYLVTSFERPFTANGFGNWFKKRCREAGLPQCSAHGLRKAGATIAADNGATAHQLMAIYAWETMKEAERYTRKANRRRLAGEAMHLLIPEQTDDKILPLSEGVGSEWEDSAKKAK